MPVLAALGNRISHLLHAVIYSFPSPSNSSLSNLTDAVSALNASAASGSLPSGDSAAGSAGAAKAAARTGGGSYASVQAIGGMMNEPGEPRALAGGVGPISFAGSGYGMTLVVVAILLNRIHHIVQRPRPPPPPLPHPPTSTYRYLRMRLIATLTSPSMPNYLRLPGLFFLIRAWILFSILTLQVAGFWPTAARSASDAVAAASGAAAEATSSGLAMVVSWLMGSRPGAVVTRVGEWAGGMEMERVCWQVFLSVCTGLVCGALANGLDRGRRRDVGAGFNLFGYSFLLHLYSSPLTHHRPPISSNHGRPDIHALLQLWLGLTELTWLQTIELSPTLRRNQLLPTGVCGAIGLMHFVYALVHSPLRFPSFTFLTHLVALFLSIIIIFTFVLKAITHIFTIGYIPSPIFTNLIPHEGVMPTVEDDFGVTLLKLGTACIEATSYSGLRNELAPINMTAGPWVELSPAGGQVVKPYPSYPMPFGSRGGFGVRIDEVQAPELEDPNAEHPYWRELHAFWYAVGIMILEGLWALVKLTPGGERMYHAAVRRWNGRWWYGPRQWRFWRPEAWAAPPLQLQPEDAAAPGTEMRVYRFTGTGRPGLAGGRRAMSYRSAEGQSRLGLENYTYDQILRGEVELPDSDDDENEEIDATWREESVSVVGDPWAGSENGEDGWGEESEAGNEFENEHENERPEFSLYRDLTMTSRGGGGSGSGNDSRAGTFGAGLSDGGEGGDAVGSSSAIQPILLAHFTSESGSPLTRRRYAAIMSGGSGATSEGMGTPSPRGEGVGYSASPTPTRRGGGMQDVVLARREELGGEGTAGTVERDEWDEERKRSCVVCMTQTRDVVLWPCRCLLMCNDCRDSLASRLPAKEHLCPNCRTKVEGYSRIYVP